MEWVGRKQRKHFHLMSGLSRSSDKLGKSSWSSVAALTRASNQELGQFALLVS